MVGPPDGGSGPERPQSSNPLALGWYLVGGMSFFPLLGVPFGLAAIVAGVLRREDGGKRLVAMGATGIALTVVVYGSLFVAVRLGHFEVYTERLAQGVLDDTVRAIEFYKLQNGEYPDSLEAVRPQESFIDDPYRDPRGLLSYERRAGGETYSIFSVGPDGVPSTDDDLHPSPEIARATGYRGP